ncbi:MAG: hypothetical protein IKA17_01940 [Clostridia bacterium]|nr:hypothetical protein [Clostridia bacterium]
MSLVCELPPKKELRESDKEDVVFWLCEAGFAGPIGAFSTIADVTALGSVWGGLFYTLASNRGLPIDKNQAIKICETILLGSAAYYIGCKAAVKFFHLIPGAGTLAAMGISSFENIVFTYRFALAVSQVLEMDEFKKGEWKKLGTVISSAFSGNDLHHAAIPINDTAEIVKMMVNPKYNVQIRECATDIKDAAVDGAKFVGEKALDITGTIYTKYQIAKMEVSEKADEIGRKVVDLSTKVISSPEFKNMERKVSEFADDAKVTIVDIASDAGDAITEGAKRLGKWLKDKWNG